MLTLFGRKQRQQSTAPGPGPVCLPLADVQPDPDQHRRYFDDQALKDLAESIKTVGQLEPVVVIRENGHFRLVAGERRWRACGLAQLPTILANVVDLSPVQIALVQATENIARQDIRPCEEGTAYRRVLLEYEHEKFPEGLCHRPSREQTEWHRLAIAWVAQQVGATSQRITSKLKLLSLPEEVRDLLDKGSIGEGHGQALVRMFDSPFLSPQCREERVAEACRMARSVAAHSTTVADLKVKVAQYLGDKSQQIIFAEGDDPATQARQKNTRDKLSMAVEHLEKAVRLTFNDRDQDFSLPALRNDELMTAEAKVRGSRKYLEQLEARLAQAQQENAPRQTALVV